jgi:FMN phosphatase YigB (HAD superfamily)
MQRKVALLDVDGVVYRHPRVLYHVGHKCVNYVSKKLQVDLPAAQSINTTLYQRFGHTLLGLQRVYDMHIEDIMEEFNSFVYDQKTLKYLKDSKDDEVVKKLRTEMREFVDFCNNKDVPVYLFSNAPYLWCREIVHMLEIGGTVPSHNILHCGHDSIGYYLKPELTAYKQVETHLRYLYQSEDDEDCLKFVFIDDSLTNLVPVMDRKDWTPIYMNKDIKLDNANILTAASMYDVMPLL